METLENIEKRHKEARLALQKKIEILKASLGKKADKKQKKAIDNKIELLTNELEAKLEEEIYRYNLELDEKEKLDEPEVEEANNTLNNDLDNTKPEGSSAEVKVQIGDKKKKKNRQKERKERKEAALQKLMEEAELEAINQPNQKELENDSIKEKISKLGLKIHEIRADGHCLYSAIADQLNLKGIAEVSHTDLRIKTAKYMRENPYDFIPYLDLPEDEELKNIAFNKYCNEIENTPVWGGQLEINALSQAYKVPIQIHQSESNPIVINEHLGAIENALNISYHRHAYTLGAHYNSLRTVS